MPTPASTKTVTYLAYLEEMTTMDPGTVVDAPGLGALEPRPAIFGSKFVRARFSGIRAPLFAEMREVLGPARDEVLSADQRQQRRAALHGPHPKRVHCGFGVIGLGPLSVHMGIAAPTFRRV
jgi:hypothetical protein